MTSLLFALAQSATIAAQAVPAAPLAPPGAPASPSAATAPSAASPTYVVEGGQVVLWQGQARTPVPSLAGATAVHLSGARLYVARGTSTVGVFDVTAPETPQLVREVSVRGNATGFHVVDGQLWVVVLERSAVPLEDAAAATPARPSGSSVATTPGTAPPASATARPGDAERPAPPRDVAILKVTPGIVELAIGARQGVRVGDRYAVLRSRVMQGEGDQGFSGEELVSVAEIVAVREESALAEVGRSAVVEKTDHARPARRDQTSSDAFPPRAPFVGELSVVLRPLVNAGRPLGVGVLADVAATYWGSAYFAGLSLQPVGLGLTDDGAVVSTAALAEGGYDGRAVSVGLGLGVSWINGDLDHMLRSFGSSNDSASVGKPSEPTVTERQETHAAFTLSQVARLGARDGLNLWLRNVLILHEDSDSKESGFIYGGTTGRLGIPVGGRSDLFLEGGGGLMGYWFFGIGVATWLTGNGSPGSWRLSVSAGGAGIFGSKEVTTTYPADGQTPAWTYTSQQGIDVAGPMVSVGVARRFDL